MQTKAHTHKDTHIMHVSKWNINTGTKLSLVASLWPVSGFLWMFVCAGMQGLKTGLMRYEHAWALSPLLLCCSALLVKCQSAGAFAECWTSTSASQSSSLGHEYINGLNMLVFDCPSQTLFSVYSSVSPSETNLTGGKQSGMWAFWIIEADVDKLPKFGE